MGEFSVTVQSEGICGLRLISFGTGFEGVQVKSQAGCEDRWHGRSPSTFDLGLMTFTELVLKPDRDGQILLSLDVCLPSLLCVISTEKLSGIQDLRYIVYTRDL